ncbi:MULTISPECIES: GntR family transcriptional regulator [Paenibacillus]|uniref:GntR family transcriptional regulator n=1 Tax=Paenibacillus TaxID=44249 RepID=UPI001C2F5FBE|nr:GntR family transcriptional regulator [Paenibacillus sp. GbtcB18]
MNIILSQSSGEPIYEQIRQQIQRQILQGELLPGEGLPSIRQLAKDLQISVITTKRAYEELEKEGLIDSVVGKGSFVSGLNREYIREQQLKQFEAKLAEAVREARQLGITVDETIETVKALYEEEEEIR